MSEAAYLLVKLRCPLCGEVMYRHAGMGSAPAPCNDCTAGGEAQERKIMAHLVSRGLLPEHAKRAARG